MLIIEHCKQLYAPKIDKLDDADSNSTSYHNHPWTNRKSKYASINKSEPVMKNFSKKENPRHRWFYCWVLSNTEGRNNTKLT